MESGERLKRGEKEGRTSKDNGGRQSKDRTQDRTQASKANKCVSATKNSSRRRERRAQTIRRQRTDWQKYGQAEEMQASFEGEMRDVGQTRPGKAKGRVTEERVNMKAKEELETKEDSRLRTQ